MKTPAKKPDDQADQNAPSPSTPPTVLKKTYLTAVSTDAFGPAGTFRDLTDDEAAAAPEGVLTEPTADQLAQRLQGSPPPTFTFPRPCG